MSKISGKTKEELDKLAKQIGKQTEKDKKIWMNYFKIEEDAPTWLNIIFEISLVLVILSVSMMLISLIILYIR